LCSLKTAVIWLVELNAAGSRHSSQRRSRCCRVCSPSRGTAWLKRVARCPTSGCPAAGRSFRPGQSTPRSRRSGAHASTNRRLRDESVETLAAALTRLLYLRRRRRKVAGLTPLGAATISRM
jgi:hypothetical protein